MIFNQAEGQLHPGKMMRAFHQLAASKGILIFSGIEVKQIVAAEKQVHLQLKGGINIEVANALIATNGFSRQLLPDLALQPARNQVVLTQPISGLKITGTFHYDRGYYYFRNINKPNFVRWCQKPSKRSRNDN